MEDMLAPANFADEKCKFPLSYSKNTVNTWPWRIDRIRYCFPKFPTFYAWHRWKFLTNICILIYRNSFWIYMYCICIYTYIYVCIYRIFIYIKIAFIVWAEWNNLACIYCALFPYNSTTLKSNVVERNQKQYLHC